MFWFKKGSPVPLVIIFSGEVKKNRSINELECSVKCVDSFISWVKLYCCIKLKTFWLGVWLYKSRLKSPVITTSDILSSIASPIEVSILEKIAADELGGR